MPNGFQDYLLGLPKEEFDSLYQKFTAAKPEPFSGARKKTYGTMGIATPQDVQFAERAKEVAPNLLESAANTVASFAPGSGEYISARQSTEDVAKAREAINNGDYASAAAHGLESVVNAVGSLPIAHQIMALGKGAVGVAKGLMGAEHIIPAITTYHGSPTSGIRKWDLNFRGTGEGRLPVDSPARESFQDMIGHGLYSAEREGIAKGYQDRLTDYEFNRNILRQMYDDLAEQQKQTKEWKAKLRGADASDADKRFLQHHLNREQSLREQIAEQEKRTKPGALYTTELTPHPDEFLLWDKPLSEQSEKVKDALKKEQPAWFQEVWHQGEKVVTDPDILARIESARPSEREAQGIEKSVPADSMTGKQAYFYANPEAVKNGRNDRAASEYLNSLGIRGIKYLDNPSRGAGEGTYNYVTFNPAEEAIITHENGKRIPGAVEEAYRKLRDPESKAIFEKRYPELKDLDKPLVNSQGNEIKNPENFKNWFGESKVVDAEGKPLVVSHYTNRDFDSFDINMARTTGHSRLGFWFTDLAKDEQEYGRKEVPAYISITNPYHISDWTELEQEISGIREGKLGEESGILKRKLESSGFDGIVLGPANVDGKDQTMYIAFSPTQIKSVNNRGTFDPNNPNILMGAAPLAAGLLGGKDDTVRNDGTEKGNGYFGVLPMRDGSQKVATEIAIGVNLGGKEVEIPTLVPTLTPQEIDHLLRGKKPTPTIVKKAIIHAKQRIKQGLSPFASSGDFKGD